MSFAYANLPAPKTDAAAIEPPKKKRRIGDGFTFTVSRLLSDTIKPHTAGCSVVSHFKNGDKIATDRDYTWSGVPAKFAEPPVYYHRGPWKGKGRYVKFEVSHDARVYITKHPSKSFGRKLVDQGFRDSGYTIEGMFGKSKQHLPCVQKGYPAGEIEIEMPTPDCCPCIFVKPRYKEMDVEAKQEKERTVGTSLEKVCKAAAAFAGGSREAADKEKFEKAANVMVKMVSHTGDGKVTKAEGGCEVYKFLAIAMTDPMKASSTTAMKELYNKLFDTCLKRKELFTQPELEQIKVWQESWITLRTVTLTDDSYEFPKACRALLKKIGELPPYSEAEEQYRGVNNSLKGAYRAGVLKGLPPPPPGKVPSNATAAVTVKAEAVPATAADAAPTAAGGQEAAAEVKTEKTQDSDAPPSDTSAAPSAPATPAPEEATGTEGDEDDEDDEEEEEGYGDVKDDADAIFNNDVPMPEQYTDPAAIAAKEAESKLRAEKRERRAKAKEEIKVRRAEREQKKKEELMAARERREMRRDRTETNTDCLQCQRRHALFQILKAVNTMYKYNWAKTAIDMLMKDVRQYINRFAPEHQQAVQQMLNDSTAASQNRSQLRQQSDAGSFTSFDAADKHWANAKVSKRGALVGGGRVTHGQEGKMFGQHDTRD